VAATRAAEAKKAAELKKAAESKKAATDPANLASSREEPAVVSKAAGATASSAGPVARGGPSASARSSKVTKVAAEMATDWGTDVAPPVVDEKMAGAESATARSPDAIPPVVEKERGAAEGSGLLAKMRERRTKAARDQARPSNPEAPAEETPSTLAVVQGGWTHESRRPPLSTLSFTELHTTLGEVHVVSFSCSRSGLPPVLEGQLGLKGRVESPFWNQTALDTYTRFSFVQAEVKRLTVLVEEATKKNRQLIAIGSEFPPFLLPVCFTFVSS
jgi:hypothetical protein